MGISLGEVEGSWLSPIAARTLSLPNEALLLLKSGEAKMDGGDTNGIRGFGAKSSDAKKEVRELVTGLEGADLLAAEGMGGMFSPPADDKSLILRILVLSKKSRFRRPPLSCGFHSKSSSALGSAFGSTLGLYSALVVIQLSRIAPAERESVVVLFVLLIEPSLFFTGKTTSPPPSPKRENLGAGSVTGFQSSVGSHEMEEGRGRLDESEVERGTPRGIG